MEDNDSSSTRRQRVGKTMDGNGGALAVTTNVKKNQPGHVEEEVVVEEDGRMA